MIVVSRLALDDASRQLYKDVDLELQSAVIDIANDTVRPALPSRDQQDSGDWAKPPPDGSKLCKMEGCLGTGQAMQECCISHIEQRCIKGASLAGWKYAVTGCI